MDSKLNQMKQIKKNSIRKQAQASEIKSNWDKLDSKLKQMKQIILKLHMQ